MSGQRRRKIDWDSGIRKKWKAGSESETADPNSEVNPWTGIPYSQRYYSILAKRTKLPVYQFKDELVKKILENQCVVVEGETGTKRMN